MLERINVWFRRPVARIWAITLCIILVVALIAVTIALHRTEDSAVNRSLEASCVINNVSRVVSNISNQDDYRVYTSIVKVVPPRDKKLRESVATAAEYKTWSTLSDCASPTYRSEIHIFSLATNPPPASVFSLHNATKLNPVGSLKVKPGVTIHGHR